jgi:hypothetical protein
MFEAKLLTTTPNDITIAAAPGHIVFNFSPPAEMKPSAMSLGELMTANSFPVTAWRIKGSVTEPLTIAAPPPGATVFLFSGAKIFQLDNARCWSARDQWEAQLLDQWKAAHPKEPAARSPGPVTIEPGQMLAIFRHSRRAWRERSQQNFLRANEASVTCSSPCGAALIVPIAIIKATECSRMVQKEASDQDPRHDDD